MSLTPPGEVTRSRENEVASQPLGWAVRAFSSLLTANPDATVVLSLAVASICYDWLREPSAPALRDCWMAVVALMFLYVIVRIAVSHVDLRREDQEFRKKAKSVRQNTRKPQRRK